MKRKIFEKLFGNKMLTVGLIITILVLILAVFKEQLAPHGFDEINIDLILKPPSREFPFGTDQLGRCILSRVIYGTAIALKVGFLVVTVETVIGVTLGMVAGFYGKLTDKVITFIADMTWSMPVLIIALAIVTVLGPSLNNVVIAIALVSWAELTRIVRTKTRAIKDLPYIEAAKAYGESDFNVLFRYILPNVAPSIIVLASLAMPSAIMSTSALGFLGLGSQPPSPDWGLILADGTNYIKTAPWLSIFPGLTMVSAVLGFNLLGEGIRDLLDPRLKF